MKLTAVRDAASLPTTSWIAVFVVAPLLVGAAYAIVNVFSELITEPSVNCTVDPDIATEFTMTALLLAVTVNALASAVVADNVSLYVSVTIVPAVLMAVETYVGGTPTGVTVGVEAPEAVEVLSPFIATDVNVYPVPLVSPVTVQLPEAPVTVHVLVASCTAVTVYPVGVIPEGAVTVTVA